MGGIDRDEVRNGENMRESYKMERQRTKTGHVQGLRVKLMKIKV